MKNKISSEVITAYSECHRKAFLIKQTKIKVDPSTYNIFMKNELEKSRVNYYQNCMDKKWGSKVEVNDLTAYLDFINEDGKIIERVTETPTLVIGTHKFSKQHKFQLAFTGYILHLKKFMSPKFGYIINRAGLRTKIKIYELYKDIEEILTILRSWDLDADFEEPPITLNRHCPLCEFQKLCHEIADKEDNLSLLGGIKQNEIKRLNRKGIFTVFQLSYTFRARKNKSKLRSFSLQAQALRDQKIYIYGEPFIPESKIEIYFDIEGIPDQDFQYLIGVLVIDGQKHEHHHFWSDTKDDELGMLKRFLALLAKYKNYTLFHYGAYETAYLKRVAKKLDGQDLIDLNLILLACCNVLKVIYSSIYFPSRSNGLKSIANLIGFNWSDSSATGLQSIVWRMQWESIKTSDIKENLIRYNREDCIALLEVKKVIRSIIDSKKCHLMYEAVSANFTSKGPGLSFAKKKYALPEIKSINKWSYFDYQRDRVHVRRKKLKKSALKREKKNAITQSKINKFVNISASKCPKCKLLPIKELNSFSKIIIDLKFFESGAKRWITEFSTNRYLCLNCKYKFIPKKYASIPRQRYGHSLKSWAIYQHIVNRESFRQIQNNCLELFNIHLPSSSSHVFKEYISQYYKSTYDGLLDQILHSPVVYIDETPFQLRSGTVYAWVLTNGYEVVSIFKPTREGAFLKDLFSSYTGVIVTDGYSAYDSLNVRHQTCLIHIIRDMNYDLLKNPFDPELKEITQAFTITLQEIIKTIDKFGLKEYFLKKHKKAAQLFIDAVISKEYRSEVALLYKNRIERNKDFLFEFLNHNDVSWNNTNAEHAIKLLSAHRNLNIKFIRETKMDVYLRILSLYQTCEYLDVSFLQFLLSGQSDIKIFTRKK